MSNAIAQHEIDSFINVTNKCNTYVAPPAINASKTLCGVPVSTIQDRALSTSSLINPLLSPFLANKALAVISISWNYRDTFNLLRGNHKNRTEEPTIAKLNS